MSDVMPKIEAAQTAKTEALRGVERAERAILNRIEAAGALEDAVARLCERADIKDHYNASAAPSDFRDGKTTRAMVDLCVRRKQADANQSEGWAFRSLVQEAEAISTSDMEMAQSARSERAWAKGGDAMDNAEALNAIETQLYDYRKAQTAHRRDPDRHPAARMPKDLEKAIARGVVSDFEKDADEAVNFYKVSSSAEIGEMSGLITSLGEAKSAASRARLKVKHLQNQQRGFLERATAAIEEPRAGYGTAKRKDLAPSR